MTTTDFVAGRLNAPGTSLRGSGRGLNRRQLIVREDEMLGRHDPRLVGVKVVRQLDQPEARRSGPQRARREDDEGLEQEMTRRAVHP